MKKLRPPRLFFFWLKKLGGPVGWAALFSIVFFACGDRKNEPPRAAFFYWKTEFELSDFEKNALNSLKINELWLRAFDIGLDEATGQIVPLAVADLQKFPTEGFAATACVFAENRVFRKISDAENDRLAERTAGLLAQVFSKKKMPLERVLIDCDWTASDREGFFFFLKMLKKRLPAGPELAATIRLHQFKNHEKTGCPPADRAVLMAYNSGDVADRATENSILDSADAAKFLDRRVDFPLPIDVALPVFRWGAIFRDGDFFKLANGLDSTQLVDYERFMRVSKNRFEVKKATFLAGHFLREGDEIRLEASEPDQIFWATRQLKKIGAKPERVLFYHLDSANVAAAGLPFFEKIVRVF